MRARIHVDVFVTRYKHELESKIEWYLNDSGYGIKDIQYGRDGGAHVAYVHYIDPNEWEMEDE